MQLAGAYDVIVNCTGMGSRDLCNDLDVVPIKGQVIKVKAPWIKHMLAINDDCAWPVYIIPRFVGIIPRFAYMIPSFVYMIPSFVYMNITYSAVNTFKVTVHYYVWMCR